MCIRPLFDSQLATLKKKADNQEKQIDELEDVVSEQALCIKKLEDMISKQTLCIQKLESSFSDLSERIERAFWVVVDAPSLQDKVLVTRSVGHAAPVRADTPLCLE